MNDFIKSFWKFYSLFGLSVALNIITNVIGSHSGSLIWGEVYNDYRLTMSIFAALSVVLAMAHMPQKGNVS